MSEPELPEEFADYTYVYTNHRYERGFSYDYGPVQRLVDLCDAIESLVKYEFGYGGWVKEVTPTKLVVQTPCLAKVDIVTFEATEKEMLPLLQIASAWAQAQKQVTTEIWSDELIKRFGTGDHITPALAVWAAPLVLGNLRLKGMLECLSPSSLTI